MTPEQAVGKLQHVLAHLWMIRTFLKHADEVQDDEELLDVPRTLFDSIRAVEPAYLRGDWADYLRRLRGKLPKLRRVQQAYAERYTAVSDHTNFHMANLSLEGAVRQIEEVFAALDLAGSTPPPGPLPETERGSTDTPPFPLRDGGQGG